MKSRSLSSTAPAHDLLPWADPYILQLFQGLASGEQCETNAASRSRMPLTVTVGQAASAEARLSREDWEITTPARREPARTRRTEFAHSLAPC
jgi:hypothetical protein